MSITLSAAQVATVTLGGVTIETSAQGVAIEMNVKFSGPDIVLTYAKGTVSGSSFTSGTQNTVSVTLNLATGFWISTNGLQGTLSGAAFTNLQNTVKGWRNSVETFAVNNNIMPGTQVAWT